MAINDWWNQDWSYRSAISSDTNGNAYTSGQNYLRVKVDASGLNSQGKVNVGYDDIRVIFQTKDSKQEIMRYIASGVNPSWVYFPAWNNIASGVNIGNQSDYRYYVYYGNPTPDHSFPTWENLNCPQAPYSVQYPDFTVSGYRDKWLLRLSESPIRSLPAANASGLSDSTSRTHRDGRTPSGIGTNILYAQPGRIERSVFIPSDAGNFINVPFSSDDSGALFGSGLFHVDVWFRPATTDANNRYIISRKHNSLSRHTSELIYFSTGDFRVQEPRGSNNADAISAINNGDWVFIRGMINVNADISRIWVKGSGIDFSGENVSATTSPFTNDSNWTRNYRIGAEDSNSASTAKSHGHIEQLRFGKFIHDLAPNGVSLGWVEPYFTDPEYQLSTQQEEEGVFVSAEIGGYTSGILTATVDAEVGGFALGDPFVGPTGIIGGFILGRAKDNFNRVGILGGYVRGEGSNIGPASIGGYVLALDIKDVPAVFIGGMASGQLSNSAEIGGYTFGLPNYSEFAELHARTLVKVRSEDIVDQGLSLDASMIMKQIDDKDFNAKLIIFDTFNSDFNAKFNVLKYKNRPSVQILSVTPPSGGLGVDGCTQVTVVASGTLGEGQEWINSYIDFGEPYKSLNPTVFNPNMSVSGFNTPPPWTATYDYCSSGKYVITARGQDNLGLVSMDAYRLNLASGLGDENFPQISISGIPRDGIVPDALKVQFTMQSSGLPADVWGFAQNLITTINPDLTLADNRIQWNFGNREISTRTSPFTYYQSPGLYAPTLRFRFIHPSGNVMWVSDTLLLGFNR